MNKNSRAYTYLLCFGHFCSDINAGCLSAILPFLIASYHYDYGTATMLVMVSNLVCSAVQLVFGSLADKKSRPWVMILGIILAALGMSLLGVIENFGGMCVAVMVSGFGTAMFHPQAMMMLNRVSADGERGNNVSIFSFGGNLGFTLGPMFITLGIRIFGLSGTLLLLIPMTISVLLLGLKGRKLFDSSAEQLAKLDTKHQVLPDQWISFLILTIAIFGRSIIASSLNTFLSLYWIDTLEQPETLGNIILSVYYGLTAIFTLIGGRWADRFGYQKMIVISFAILMPSIFVLALTKNMVIAAFLLVPLSVGTSISYSPVVVLGQLYLPNHTGFASGVTLGLAVSIGGIMAPILGRIADGSGIDTALLSVAFISIVPFLASFFLRKPDKISTST